MEKKHKHKCGCITMMDSKRVVSFVKICEKHKIKAHYWIALQHPGGRKAQIDKDEN